MGLVFLACISPRHKIIRVSPYTSSLGVHGYVCILLKKAKLALNTQVYRPRCFIQDPDQLSTFGPKCPLPYLGMTINRMEGLSNGTTTINIWQVWLSTGSSRAHLAWASHVRPRTSKVNCSTHGAGRHRVSLSLAVHTERNLDDISPTLVS